MNPNIRNVVYPVKDMATAKALFSELLGVKPYADQPYYVGYRIEGLEIGLDPNGHNNGMTMPIVYYRVGDIKQALQALQDMGAQVQQAPKDVGGGMLIATAKDADGNVIGLSQEPSR